MRDANTAGPSDGSTAGSTLPHHHRLNHEECLALYRRQAELMWKQGTFSRRDRALLDQLQSGLGLSLAEAVELEAEAARSEATPEELSAGNQPLPSFDEAPTGLGALPGLLRKAVHRKPE